MKRIKKIVGGTGLLSQGKETSVHENLYLSVNGKWMETAQIPSDRSRIGGFTNLAIDVEKKLRKDLVKFAEDSDKIKDPYLKETINFYQLAYDFKKRDQYGTQPAMSSYNFYKEIKDISDLKSKIKRVVLDNNFALSFWVSPDMKNTVENLLYVGAPSLLLPDKQYYGTASEKSLMPIFRKMCQKVLANFGESEEDANSIIQNMIDFDHLLVPLVKSSEEKADHTKYYNPISFSDFNEKTSDFNLGSVIVELSGVEPKKISLTDPRYFDNLSKILNDDNFPKFHDWMLLNTALAATPYLSDQIRVIGGEFSRAVNGIKEASSKDRSVYQVTNSFFDEIIGIYYGKTYFGDQAREDVKKMVQAMIQIYKKRLKENFWLSDHTIKKAIVKLDAIKLKIGYPDQPREVYKDIKVDKKQSLYENVENITYVLRKNNLKDLSRPVDQSRWGMPGNLVNACYDPQVNDITFPAAILQAPFYSLDQTIEENYGGIGAVIAHEISHAFDNNGAKFDELGNMNNWWTEEDYREFEKRCEDIIQEFDNIKIGSGKVNGKLVVSENVADQGGLSCALEATKQEPDSDLKKFFINWARIWRTKDSPQLTEMLLAKDVHAPNILRANIQAQNLDDFYSTFKITEGDGMWLDKDKRVSIW